MTDQRLRDLLHDRVADLDPDDLGDLGGPAWARARRTRHRRAAVVGGGAVAAVLAATAVAVLPGDGPAPPAQNPTKTQTPSVPSPSVSAPTGPAPKAVRAGEQHGAQVWWAPDKSDEAALPRLQVAGVPEQVDLSAGSPPHRAGVRATAMFMVGDGDRFAGRVVILGTDASTYSLDVGRLEPVADEQGNQYLPFNEESLSPSGRFVLFRQQRSLEVYELDTGEWTTIDTPDWLAEGARWSSDTEIWVPHLLGAGAVRGTTYDVDRGRVGPASSTYVSIWETGAGSGYGPLRTEQTGQFSGRGPSVAQAQFPGVSLTDPTGTLVSGADAVVTGDQSGQEVSVLVLPYGLNAPEGRWKMCCPVVGWLDGGRDTLLFASRGSDSRVLAWRVGTPDLFRVTQLTGWVPGQDYHVASYADLKS
ncbi:MULTISPECIES: hypothetical protein [Nocardioides]|uniref:WD40 repeat domain-containing protein n=1 Tax=Nocardioides vastitatis TaxID=2568655 RepID=A0ABW0ZJQ8_9ACTN|nr:hypothetical protein [Nocardioides sp.]THJ15107.1 hypothetical protein E7Z54_00840 [Nocardioides sp.]